MAYIEVSNLVKYFGVADNRIKVLKSLNLTIDKGDFVAIIGQSGSGKSTLMNILGCLDTPSEGSYKIEGVETNQMGDDALAQLRSNTFGFIFQRYNLLSHLTALENVALPAIYNGVEYAERMQRAERLLDELGLKERIHNKPNELSGGQQQRVSIARALMNGGEIILADEPTGALDSKSGENVMGIITELHEKGHTIILVTHDPKIANYANRVIEIKDGEIIADIRQKEEASHQTLALHEKPKKSLFRYYQEMFYESFKMSVQAIFAHKMRSLLTMLGIIIGITSVVLVVALGKGSTENIMENINSMGTNTIDILPGKDFGDMHSGKIKTLTVDDALFLREQGYIDSSTPNSATSGTLTYKHTSATAQLSGVGEQYFSVKGLSLESGRMLNRKDIDNNLSVVVIDQNVKNKYFREGENILGETLIFNKKPLTIIGIAKKTNSMGMNSDTLTLWTPYTTLMNRVTGGKNISSITVKVADGMDSKLAENNIEKILTARHKTKDFFMINTDSIKQTIESTTNTMTLLIASIAFISLVVGGIGVMNIMLVSVTERTQEIGLRMAIGAKKMNILQQFLIEAVLICIIGGVLGITFSLMIGGGLKLAMDNAIPLSFSVDVMAFALVFSMVVGVVFGFMPARNAAKLNPIEALTKG